MKQFITNITFLISLMLTVSACHGEWEIEWDWDDDEDQGNVYANYVMSGSWYPMYKAYLTDCQYNSYMIFSDDGIVRYYDCSDAQYNDADFYFTDNQMYLSFDSYNESYTILTAANNQLEIRNNKTGVYYYYTRQE